MGEWFQQLLDTLNLTHITFIGILIAALVLAEILRRWFSRLFNRMEIPQNIRSRLLALLFLIVLAIGIGLAFNLSGISTTGLHKFFTTSLTDLFQLSEKQDELDASPEDEKQQVSPEDGTQLTLEKLFYAFVIIFGAFVLSKYAQWVLRRQVLQAFQIERHTQFLILRFFHISFITVSIIISFGTLGLNLTSMALIFGGLSIGIGFGLQNLASNLISGVILIFEKPIKIGDLIEIMDIDVFGRVSAINFRSTVIVALDEKEIIVPNSQLISEPVHNLTHYNDLFRVRIPVGVSYKADVELVKRVLLEVAHAHPEVIKAPIPDIENVTVPFVRFINFGESALNFELFAWIPDSFKRFDIASDLHFMIWEKFKEYKIQIPYPQRDVHLYPTEPYSE